jgi:hypothetical protein
VGESVIATCHSTVTDCHWCLSVDCQPDCQAVSRLTDRLSVSRLSLTLYQTLGTGIPDVMQAVHKTPGTSVPGVLQMASKLLWYRAT